jgi:hypothetical protein
MMKRKLRPWVKVALAFIIGVTVTSQIFKVFDSDASTGGQEVFHGVISMNVNGETHIKHIDGGWDYDITIDRKKGYEPLEIVTVVVHNGVVVNNYLTEGDELQALEGMYQKTIDEYRSGIVDSLYE